MSSFSEVQQATCQILKDDERSHSGTGFLILPGGYILTCFHVIGGLRKFLVKLNNDQKPYQAEYLKEFSNPTADFAVLKLCDVSSVSIGAVQLGRIREKCEVYGFGFRPNNISIEPEGHSFHGDLRPGQKLQFGERKNKVLNFYGSEDIPKGVSGGPIYDIQLCRVVGFFKARETNNPSSQIAYVIPMDEIFAHWPDLEKENIKQVPDKKEDLLKRNFDIQPVSEGGKPISLVSMQQFEQIFPSHRIFGRREQLARLDQFVDTETNGYYFITGPAGFGKTTLLSNWATSLKLRGLHVAIHFFRQTMNTDLYTCLKNLCEQLMEIYGWGENIPPDVSKLQVLFNDLLKLSPPSNIPIVIILDGLDEAVGWPNLYHTFPSNLQKGIFFVVSMRDEIDEIDSLKKRLRCTNHIILPKLIHADIVDWLQSSENDTLKSLSIDKNFTEELTRKTDGFPLYLHYLIDEIINSPIENAYQVLERSPQDFSLYIQDQFSLLAKTNDIENNRRFLELFALLTIAHSALSEDDVIAMTEITEWDFQGLPWSLKRWFNIITTDTSRLYSFTHPLLALEFKRALRNDSKSALKKMLDYCSNFQRHKSPYTFRHYTEHLLETQQYEKLFAVVDNETFWEALFETFPEDLLQAISKNFNAVLRAAIETDNIERITQYLLLHAMLLEVIRDMTPTGALSRGNLQLAWELADSSEHDESVLWYLFLSWELKNSGRLEESNKTLNRLLTKYYPKSSHIGGWEEYTAALLVHVYDVSEEAFYQFQQRFFKDNDKFILCKYLCMSGNFVAANKIVLEFRNLTSKVRALIMISSAQMHEGEIDDAISSLNFAMNLSTGFRNLKKKEEIQLSIKEAQARAYSFSSLIETKQSDSFCEEFKNKVLNNFNSEINVAKKITDVDSRINTLVTIAEIQSRKGEKKLARKAFSIAIEYAQQIPESKFHEIRQVSTNYFESSTFVRSISEKSVKLSYIARKQANVDDFISALETSEMIEDRAVRVDALAHIVKKQADKGDLTSALEVSQRIEREIEKGILEYNEISTRGIDLLQGINSLDVVSPFDLKSGPIISTFNSYLIALASIAFNQAKCGKEELASDTFYKAVNFARRHFSGMWIVSLKPVIEAMIKVNVFAFDIESSHRVTETMLLKHRTLIKIVEILSKRKDFRLAVDVVSDIYDRNEMVRLLALIAENCSDNKKDSLLALELAQIIVRKIIRKEYKAINLTIIAKAAARIEEAKLAKKTFKKALKMALSIEHNLRLLPPDFEDKQFSINSLSIETSKAIEVNSKRWNTLKAISRSQAEVGFYTDAIKTAYKIEYRIKKEEAMQFIATAQVKSGNITSAFETINKMTDSTPRNRALNSVFEELTEPLDLEYALRKVEQIEIKQRDNLLGLTVKAYVKLGDLDSAINEAMRIEWNWEKEQSLKFIAKAKAEIGDFSSAFIIIRKLEKDYDYYEILEFISKAQAKANDFTSALETAQGIKDKYQLNSILESIAVAQAQVGNYISATDTAKEIKDTLEKVKVFAAIAKEQISVDRYIEAKLTLDTALNLTTEIYDDIEKKEALVSIINVNSGNNDRIVKIAETILTDRSENLSDIAEALIFAGDIKNFKKLLIPCSFYLESAFNMCRLLIKSHPDKSQAILKIVIESESLLSNFSFVTNLNSSRDVSIKDTKFSPKIIFEIIYEKFCKKFGLCY